MSRCAAGCWTAGAMLRSGGSGALGLAEGRGRAAGWVCGDAHQRVGLRGGAGDPGRGGGVGQPVPAGRDGGGRTDPGGGAGGWRARCGSCPGWGRRMSLHWRLTVILGTGQLLAWALTYYIPAITTEAVAAGLGVSRAAVLGGFSVALLATGLASPWACRRIDQVGGRTVLVGGVLLQAAGLLVMAGAGGLVQWYAGWVLTGFGMAGGLYDAAFATAGRMIGAGARPTITGITMLGGFASTLGWPLGAALMPVIGWRWVAGGVCRAAAGDQPAGVSAAAARRAGGGGAHARCRGGRCPGLEQPVRLRGRVLHAAGAGDHGAVGQCAGAAGGSGAELRGGDRAGLDDWPRRRWGCGWCRR